MTLKAPIGKSVVNLNWTFSHDHHAATTTLFIRCLVHAQVMGSDYLQCHEEGHKGKPKNLMIGYR